LAGQHRVPIVHQPDLVDRGGWQFLHAGDHDYSAESVIRYPQNSLGRANPTCGFQNNRLRGGVSKPLGEDP
jgi:hypothetical protein